MAAPYVKIVASVSGGAPTSGGLAVLTSDTVQLDLESTAGIATVLWEIYDYPVGYAGPAGWTVDAPGNRFWYAGLVPPVLDMSGAPWGKYLLRATGDNGVRGGVVAVLPADGTTMRDESTALVIYSQNGLVSVAAFETTQFDSVRGWAGQLKQDLHAIDSLLGGGGGGGASPGWVRPVLSRDENTPPGSPTGGDRYMLGAAPTGDWSGHAYQIAEWSGATWVFTVPEDGTTVWIDDEDLELTWTGTAWVQSGLPTTAALDDVLSWNGTAWVAGAVPTGFSVSSFTGPTTTQETGATITTPSFTATYSATPSSASVSDNVGAGSTAWSNPYTSGTRAGSFTKSTSGQSVTFTLSAVRGGTTATKTLTVTWASRVFYGVATIPGAYNEAFIEGLASSVVSTTRARTIAVTASGAQHVYYCLPVSYGTPTFTTNGLSGGFTKVASAVSVTNANGATTTYDVWESNQAGIGSQSIVIT